MAILTCADRDPVWSPGCGPRFEPPPAREILAVPRVVTSCSQSNHIGCQTDIRGSFDPQRLSGAVSTSHRCRLSAPSIALPTENRIFLPLLQNRHSDMPNQVIERKPNGQFAKGSSGNLGGNAQRTRHALNADTIREMHLAFRRGGRKAIEKVMRNQPAVFLKLLVLLVPREMKVEQSGGIKAMTTEQIERGIELIKDILAKREAAANAKVVEGVAEPAALPAPRKPRRKTRKSDTRTVPPAPR